MVSELLAEPLPGLRSIPVAVEGVKCLMHVNRFFRSDLTSDLARGIRQFLATPVYFRPQDNLIILSYRGDAQRLFMEDEVGASEPMFARVGEPLTRSRFGNGYRVITARDIPGNLITREQLESGMSVIARARDIGRSSAGNYYVLDLIEKDDTFQEIEEAKRSGAFVEADMLGFNRPSSPTTAVLSFKTGLPNLFLPLSHTSRYAGPDVGNKISFLSHFIDTGLTGKVFEVDGSRFVGKFSTALAQDELLSGFEGALAWPFQVMVTEASYKRDGSFAGFEVLYRELLKGFLPASEWIRPSEAETETFVGVSLAVTLMRLQPHRGYTQLIVRSHREENEHSEVMLEAFRKAMERRS